MEKRWKDAMVQGTIGVMPLLMGTLCMLLVVERLTDVSLKCTLHLLNFEGT
jgi:hypothetical protein